VNQNRPATTPEYTPEFRLLLASAQYPLQGMEVERLRAACNLSIDWATFNALVERHLLLPTVYRNLSAYAPGLVPAHTLDEFKERAELNRQYIVHILAELGCISKHNTGEGIKLYLANEIIFFNFDRICTAGMIIWMIHRGLSSLLISKKPQYTTPLYPHN